MTERYSIRIAVYVIFEKDGKVLLSLRKTPVIKMVCAAGCRGMLKPAKA